MTWLYLVYFILGIVLFAGASFCRKGEWNEEYTSLKQTRMLQGVAALGVAFHHIAQKTCGSWHPSQYIVHGLDFFLDLGYIFVAVFFFLSGVWLYKSLKTKPDYLKHFFLNRVLPIIIAFYLAEFLYLILRLLMGQYMTPTKVLWYLSGLHMANENGWYLVVIPFFYLFFWLAFRFIRNEWAAISAVFVLVLLYTAGCTLVDHQYVWWIRGEWWYNSVILFPFGLLCAKLGNRLTRLFRKGWLFWLLLSIVCIYGALQLSGFTVDRLGYYVEGFSLREKFLRRAGSAASQWLVCLAVIWCVFLFLMKCRIGNRILALYGALSLDFYITHGAFVELFGFNFMDTTRSLSYVRDVPLFTLIVITGGTISAFLFRWLRGIVMQRFGLREKPKTPSRLTVWIRRYSRWFTPAFVLLLMLGMILSPLFTSSESSQAMNGVIMDMPDGYIRTTSDTYHASWQYKGTEKKPGWIVLDGALIGKYTVEFTNVDEVIASCDWLRDMELYVNPQNIRMVRGYSMDIQEGAGQERRYYVETPHSVLLISMREDPRYYSVEDCESVLLQLADSIRIP